MAINNILGEEERRSPCGERGLKCIRRRSRLPADWSLPMRGAWIEIYHIAFGVREKSVAPHAGAWIEIILLCENCHEIYVAPHAGAWIEIINFIVFSLSPACRSPCGERGLKCRSYQKQKQTESRSPCGERGLKYTGQQDIATLRLSLPMRGAWIEI